MAVMVSVRNIRTSGMPFQAVFAILFVAATFARSEARPLDDAAIKSLVSGAIIHIDTPLNTQIPVKYNQDGNLNGAAGSMGFYLGASKDTGKWWVERNRLCHKWKRWFDGDTQCLRLKKTGKRIFWTSDTGRSGTAVLTRKAPDVQVTRQTAEQNMPSQDAAVSNTATETIPKSKPFVVASVAAEPRQTIAAPSVKPTSRPSLKQKTKAVIPPPKRRPQRRAVETKKPAKAMPVNSAYVSAVATSASDVARADQDARNFRVTHVEYYDVLNMRREPSEYSEIVGRIPPSGRDVKIIGACKDWWCPVRHRDRRGWVNRFYLAAQR